MSTDVMVRAEGLGKKYLIRHRAERERYTALRDVIPRAFAKIGRSIAKGPRAPKSPAGAEIEEFWALENVNFEIRRGEVVGIIGRNGAGKSTLLKVLSRITEPSVGRVEIRGRVASLLEVGTGFHPELTGRENIFLNGAVLGMTQSEIRRKFDEIVAFAEVERFLDTPVKRYSSGMYVRLAFAVAAHLEPEILVVDEVLAVGDAEFQRKCLGKMKDVAGHGRTVLFVSHNMAAIETLCSRALLLAGGGVASDGQVGAVIDDYTITSTASRALLFDADPNRPCIVSVSVDPEVLRLRDLVLDIGFASPQPLQAAIGGVSLRTSAGEAVWGSNGRFHSHVQWAHGLSIGVIRCEARGLPVTPGHYNLSVWLADWHEDYDGKIDVLSVFIGEDKVGVLRPPSSVVGHLDWPATWRTIPNDAVRHTTALQT